LSVIFISKNYDKKIITARRIDNLYNDTLIKKPNNIHFSIFQCVNKGFLRLIGSSNGGQDYKITESGKKHIEDRINYSKLNKRNTLTPPYETEEQKKDVYLFISSINQQDYMNIRDAATFESQLILILFYLKKTGITKPVRTIVLYQILIQMYGYSGLHRTIQSTLSKARPKVKKLKFDSKIHYMLTEFGEQFIKENEI